MDSTAPVTPPAGTKQAPLKPPDHPVKIRRALVSVSDKTGIVEFARALVSAGVELVSTGGTLQALETAGLPVMPVSDVTGFPEILDGRVKTLHPAVHAGLLAVAENPEHARQLRTHRFRPFELLVVNLYPFRETVAREDHTLDEAIEQIDIGGPAMVRAAAKNYRSVAVVVKPSDYEKVVAELHANDGCMTGSTRFALACSAFAHTAEYDAAIASYLSQKHSGSRLPDILTVTAGRALTLRYGENPHQSAALYGDFHKHFEQLHGKELSYNNILDIQAAVSVCAEFDHPTAVIVKHNNPCGVGSDGTPVGAYRKALATDSKSAYGGIVAFNRPIDEETATAMDPLFLEVIVAPAFADEALPMLRKKKDRRLLRQVSDPLRGWGMELRSVFGSVLVQEHDARKISPDLVKVVTQRKPTNDELEAMMFAWRVAKHVRSNAIVYAAKDRTLGVGAGQMSRVDSAKLAAWKAQDARLDLRGCAVASDAFFPFVDGLLEAVQAGARAVIQPGGSIRDEEVIRAADEHQIAMVFTGVRHFRH
jgi:phosphoribosylaminoimidazolecarboxamide formyltransferase/IMP cyclohydrolase